MARGCARVRGGGADGVRIAKCESAGDVIAVEKAIEAAEEEFR